jgi:Carboxypeptidase regulatory-like domain
MIMNLPPKIAVLALVLVCSSAALFAQTPTPSCRSLTAGNNFLYPNEQLVGNLACKNASNSAVAQRQTVLTATGVPVSDPQPAPPAPTALSDTAVATQPESIPAEAGMYVAATGSVTGIVLDISGASIPGAEVSLMHEDGTELHTTMSGANGEFNFTKMPSGSYLVIVNAKDFAIFTSAEFVVADQQVYEVPDVSLSVAAASMEITVRPTEFIAAEQIRAAEKQRLMGVIPNFYTSYVIDAAPLTASQKFRFAVRGTFDPVSMVGVGFGAGIEQATNAYAGYGQGAAGYAKRFAAKFADGRSSDFLTHAVFPSLLRQDPRYYYQGSGSAKSRLAHAVTSAFLARSDTGLTVPNYSYLLGDLSSAALSNLYYPKANRGPSLVFTIAAVGLAGRISGNVLREFSKRLTTNTPGNEKP